MTDREKPALARPLDGRYVLVVEDNDDARTLYATLLSMNGAQVTAVSSVAEAMLALERTPIHAIVSDIDMPDEDGYDLIAQVRALGPDDGGRLPAIAVTGHGGAEDRRRLLAAGFDAHLPKPVEAVELVDTIQRLIS